MLARTLLYLAALALSAHATSTGRNAGRLASGLSPARPRRLFDASRTASNVARSQTSLSAGDTIQGTVSISPSGPTRKRDGSQYYFANDGITTDSTQAVTLSYVIPQSSDTPVDVIWPFQYLRDSAPLPYLMAVGVQGNQFITGQYYPGGAESAPWLGDLGSDDTNAAHYGTFGQESQSTGAGSYEHYVSGSSTGLDGWVETTMFKVDQGTGEVSVNWVNYDGSLPETTLCVGQVTEEQSEAPVLILTGDESALPASAGPVVCGYTLFFDQTGVVSAAPSP